MPKSNARRQLKVTHCTQPLSDGTLGWLLSGPPHLTAGTFHALRVLSLICIERDVKELLSPDLFQILTYQGGFKKYGARIAFKQLCDLGFLQKSSITRGLYEIRWNCTHFLAAFGPLILGSAASKQPVRSSHIHEAVMSLHLFQTLPYVSRFRGIWQIPEIDDGTKYRELCSDWERAHSDKLTFRQRFDKFITNQPADTQYWAAKLLYHFLDNGTRSATWEELRNAGRIAQEHRYFSSLRLHYVLLCLARITYYDACTRVMYLSNDFEIKDLDEGLEEYQMPETVRFIWEGIMGIHRAKRRIRAYHGKHGKPPSARAKAFKTIYNHVSQGKWAKWGIPDWQTLIEECGFKRPPRSIVRYVGLEGLRYAQREILAYYETNGGVPRADQFGGIRNALKRGEWIEYGVTNWTEFLASIDLMPLLERGKWLGVEGLDRAIRTVQDFERKYGVVPTRMSRGMLGIIGAINKGHWNNLPDGRSVATWTELILLAGLVPHDAFRGRLGDEWEMCCTTVAKAIYSECNAQKTLPNGKIPDLIFVTEDGETVVADAKTHTFTESIPESVQKYIGFCDRMELWCYLGAPRETEFHEGKRVDFLFPSDILGRVTDLDIRQAFSDALEGVHDMRNAVSKDWERQRYAYKKRVQQEAKLARMKEDGVKTIEEFTDEQDR